MQGERHEFGRVALALAFAAGLGEGDAAAVRTKLRRLRTLGIAQASRPDALTDRDLLDLALGLELLQFGIAPERAAALVTRGRPAPTDALVAEWSDPHPKGGLIVQFPRRLAAEDDRQVDEDPLAVISTSDLTAWLRDDGDAVGRLLVLRVGDLVRRVRRGLQRAALR